MSIISTSNRWLNNLYKTVAILLVLLAVAISAFRLFLPYVHHYRLPLQNYLNEKAQTEMSIGTLSMIWQDFGPSLVIGELKILDSKYESVSIEKLELQVDFWQSITQRALISRNLILSRAKVHVDQQLWQFKKPESATNSPEIDTEVNDLSHIADHFINRIKRFSILDSQLTIKNNAITRNLHINQLNWLNNGDHHQAQGSVVLNGLSSNNLKLKLDLNGEDSSDLTGQVYLQANQIDITPWLDSVLAIDDEKTKTDINFSTWLNINESKLSSLKVELSDSRMDWLVNGKNQQLVLGNGQFLLLQGSAPGNFNLYSTPLSLKLNEQAMQEFSVTFAKKLEGFTLNLSEIDAAMLAQLAPLIVANTETRELISTMSISGKIEDLYLRNKNNKLQITTNFTNFNNSYSHGIPGLNNVSGQLSFVDDYLAIDFNATKGELDFDKLFVQAFPYDILSGRLNVAFSDDGWTLAVEKADFLSKEINLSARVNVDAPSDGEVNLGLLANIYHGNAGLVGRYLPLPIMSKDLVKYLNSAVVSGRIEDAQVLINGPIARFPFGDSSGIFVVDAELSKAKFKFVESWPAITDLNANLNFTNNSMLITGRGGQLTGLDVTGVSAGISDLAHEGILIVEAEIKPSDTRNISALINQSPLKASVGSALDFLQITGEVSGDFYLNLPLENSKEAVASGKIVFNNNQFALKAPAMKFSEVQGQLYFNNDHIDTQDLQLIWQGLPLALDIIGQNKSGYYNTDIKLSALWQESEWVKHVPKELQQYTQGELPWQGALSLNQHHHGGFSYSAQFDSDLNTTQLRLPSPYVNDATHKNLFSVNIDGDDKYSKIVLNYGDEMHFSGQLQHDITAFTHANLMLGDGFMMLPNKGFHITTKLDYVDFSVWQPFISNILKSTKSKSDTDVENDSTPLLAKPERIRGSIEQLDVLGQKLNNVSYNLLDQADWWLLQLNAAETRSKLKFYPDWLKQGVDVNAEFLNLSNTSKKKEKPLLGKKAINKAGNDSVFASIPPLNFHCDSCSLGLLNLGTVDAKIERVDDTVSFTQFKAKHKGAELDLNGRWLHNEQESYTVITGKLLVDDIESEMKALSFASIVKDSGGTLDFNFDWDGGLHDFDLSQLNGNLKVRLDDGYLADVSDKARIFSVLSLQSLVRKLTLDFRDIFSDGMFYSSITGDYQLQEGLLTTNNTEMNGTAGNLFMTGQTNLITTDLNYDMSYKPELTSSLPVLAWIATLNPVTFLAGVAIDQVIKSQVVSEFNFKLTGTMEKPNFQEVDRKSKNISVDTALPAKELSSEPTEKTPSTIPAMY